MDIKSMYARVEEITTVFRESGMTRNFNGKEVIKPIQSKDGWWVSELLVTVYQPIADKVLNHIRSKNGLANDTYIPYGTFALKTAKSDSAKANIEKINAIIKKNVDKTLIARYGHLVQLQTEYFELKAKIKEYFAEREKINNIIDDLDDITVDVDVDMDNLDIEI